MMLPIGHRLTKIGCLSGGPRFDGYMQVEYPSVGYGDRFDPGDVRTVTMVDGYNDPGDVTVC